MSIDVPSERWHLATQVLHIVVTMGIKDPLLPYCSLVSTDAGMFQLCLLTTINNLQKIEKEACEQPICDLWLQLFSKNGNQIPKSTWELILRLGVRSGCHNASSYRQGNQVKDSG